MTTYDMTDVVFVNGCRAMNRMRDAILELEVLSVKIEEYTKSSGEVRAVADDMRKLLVRVEGAIYELSKEI